MTSGPPTTQPTALTEACSITNWPCRAPRALRSSISMDFVTFRGSAWSMIARPLSTSPPSSFICPEGPIPEQGDLRRAPVHRPVEVPVKSTEVELARLVVLAGRDVVVLRLGPDPRQLPLGRP